MTIISYKYPIAKFYKSFWNNPPIITKLILWIIKHTNSEQLQDTQLPNSCQQHTLLYFTILYVQNEIFLPSTEFRVALIFLLIVYIVLYQVCRNTSWWILNCENKETLNDIDGLLQYWFCDRSLNEGTKWQWITVTLREIESGCPAYRRSPCRFQLTAQCWSLQNSSFFSSRT